MSAGHARLNTLMTECGGAAALSRKTGVNAGTLRKLARAGSRPNLATRKALACVIDMSLWDTDDEPRAKRGPKPTPPAPLACPVAVDLPTEIAGDGSFTGDPALTRAYAEARGVALGATTNRDLARGLAGMLTTIRSAVAATHPALTNPNTTDVWTRGAEVWRAALTAAGLETDLVDSYTATAHDPWPYDLHEATVDLLARCDQALKLDLATTDRLLIANALGGAAKLRSTLEASDRNMFDHPDWLAFKASVKELLDRANRATAAMVLASLKKNGIDHAS